MCFYITGECDRKQSALLQRPDEQPGSQRPGGDSASSCWALRQNIQVSSTL